MIARGALGNPWIFREALALWKSGEAILPATLTERREAMRRHFAALIEDKGEYIAIREMRKHIGWYFKGIPRSAEIRRRGNEITSAKELFDLIGL